MNASVSESDIGVREPPFRLNWESTTVYHWNPGRPTTYLRPSPATEFQLKKALMLASEPNSICLGGEDPRGHWLDSHFSI
jgi:hypothetical protein